MNYFKKFFLLACTLVVSCNNENENPYTFTMYEVNNTDGALDSLVKTITAVNDSSAYAQAFESFTISEAVYAKMVYNDSEMARYGHKPISFRIQDSTGKELTSINDSVLLSIRTQSYQNILGRQESSKTKHSRSYHSYSKSSYRDQLYRGHSSNSNWRDRMETDEYNKSLTRELLLKQAGLKDAAKIERAQRNKYLRDGGYDSKDGGKQVHYNGSAQQQRDLEAIDQYMKEHPDF